MTAIALAFEVERPFVRVDSPVIGTAVVLDIAEDGTTTPRRITRSLPVMPADEAVRLQLAGQPVDCLPREVALGGLILARPPECGKHWRPPTIMPVGAAAYVCPRCQGGVDPDARVVQIVDVPTAAEAAKSARAKAGKAIEHAAAWHAINTNGACPECGTPLKMVSGDPLICERVDRLAERAIRAKAETIPGKLLLPEFFGVFAPGEQPPLRKEFARLADALRGKGVIAHYAQCAHAHREPERWYAYLPPFAAGLVDEAAVSTAVNNGWKMRLIDTEPHGTADAPVDWRSLEAALEAAFARVEVPA